MKKRPREQIRRAPTSPGVYLFRGLRGKVLYVGKAKRLRDRLRSYINPVADERPSVALLVPQIETVEWLITDTEKEALLLENSLIKEHRPRYNIDLRDDKSYVSLKLTKHEFPRLFVTRRIVKDGSEYFGPYSSVRTLRWTLKLLQKLFQIRDCSDSFYRNRTRACLQHQIQRCTAPCVDLVSREDYGAQVKQVRMFLKGRKDELLRNLKSDMERASKELRYEDAVILRDRIAALTETAEPQQVESRQDEEDMDAVGLAGDQEASLVKILHYRNGRMIAANEFLLSEPEHAKEEILRAFIQQFYLEDVLDRFVPSTILFPVALGEEKEFAELLSEKAGRKVSLVYPRRGRRRKILDLANKNAQSSLAEKKRVSEANKTVLEELQRRLHLPRYPRVIEGYDISNFQGAQSVGSQVCFSDGEPDKTRYRHYKIKTVQGSNDFASLKEVFERRFRKLDEDNRPDLVLVDGGKGQLQQLVTTFEEMGVEDVPVASIAKEKELRSRSGTKLAPERIFLPGQKNPIILPGSNKMLHLLQRVRDEAHRFGIEHHRRSRGKETLQSLLMQVPGVGNERRKRLLRRFGSMKKIERATLEDFLSVEGIPENVASALVDFFQQRQERNGATETSSKRS